MKSRLLTVDPISSEQITSVKHVLVLSVQNYPEVEVQVVDPQVQSTLLSEVPSVLEQDAKRVKLTCTLMLNWN